MCLLIEKGNYGEPYNICNGEVYQVQEILDMLIEISGINAKIVSDEKLFRLSDEPVLLGDNTKINKLGYVRKYSMRQTLEAVFSDWENRI